MMTRISRLMLAGAVVWVLLLAGAFLRHPRVLAENLQALRFSEALITGQAAPAAARQDGETCRLHWLRGLLAHQEGRTAARDTEWRSAIDCDQAYIRLMRLVDAGNVGLAEYATTARPGAAESWFWLAEAVGGYSDYKFRDLTQKDEIIGLLQTGLSLSPDDGLRWRLLGDLFRQADPESAISAYLQSCFNGDPGSNGCWLAGQVAEENGLVREAIEYYRYSNWQGALDRADVLESQLGQDP